MLTTDSFPHPASTVLRPPVAPKRKCGTIFVFSVGLGIIWLGEISTTEQMFFLQNMVWNNNHVLILMTLHICFNSKYIILPGLSWFHYR